MDPDDVMHELDIHRRTDHGRADDRVRQLEERLEERYEAAMRYVQDHAVVEARRASTNVRQLEARLDALGHEHRALLERVEQLERYVDADRQRQHLPRAVERFPYVCTSCGYRFAMHPPPTASTACPECGETAIRRQEIPA